MNKQRWLTLVVLAVLLVAASPKPALSSFTPVREPEVRLDTDRHRGLNDVVYGEWRAHMRANLASATPDWWDESDQAGAYFGHAVRSAGDVNGDGYDDVIVGTNSYDQGTTTDAGGAWVYYGSATGLSDTPDWTATPPSIKTSGFFGWAVGTAGDVNGDGYDDIMIAMVNYYSSFSDEGAVFVWYGSDEGLGANYNWMARGNATYAHLGWDLGTAGDVNGDTYDDIIVGAWRYDYNNISHAYVWLGSENGLDPDSSRPVGTPTNADWKASAPMNNVNGHAFGSRVGTAGDVNGDTYDDVFVGAPRYDNGHTDEGGVFIWYGSDTGLGDNGTLANADWSAESNQTNAQLSGDPRSYVICGAGTAGDVNGDGYDDFIAGSHNYNNGEIAEGIALLWFGSENGLDPDGSRPTGYPTNVDWMAESNQANTFLGFEFGESGDLNGDGYDDVLISASYYDITGTVPITNAGAAFAWFGSELVGPGEDGTPSNADWVAEGDQVGATLGFSLDFAGDVNGDGTADVIAGAPGYDYPEENEGRAYAYYFNPIPTITSLSPASATVGGPAFTLTVNGTGFVDLASTVRWNGSNRTTTYVSNTQVTASISAADIATAGTASVTVINSAPGGGTSNIETFTINNPIPTITSLSPASTTVGGSTFTLTVNGTGFLNGVSTVRWNGFDRATIYVSSTQLTASISATDIATAGTASVTVLNNAPGGGTSNAMTFSIDDSHVYIYLPLVLKNFP